MLVLEFPWKPAELDQLIGRVDRSGQTLPSTIRFMVSHLTIDKQMLQMIEEKEVMTVAANQGIDIVSEKSGMKTVIRMLIEEHKTKTNEK